MLKGFILGVITTLFLTGATLSSINPDVARDKICKFVNYIFGKGKDFSKHFDQRDYQYDEDRSSF